MDKRISDLMLGQRTSLTNIALGYSNDAFVGRFALPQVNVSDLAIMIPSYGKDHFRVYNTERALRGQQKLLDPTSYGKVDIYLHEHGIGYPLDIREIAASAGQNLDLEIYGTKVVKDAIDLGDEVRIADMLQNLASYPSGNKVTLTGNDQWTDVDSHPIAQIDTAKEAIRNKIGKYPNVMILGHSAFNSLKNHKEIKDAIFGVNKPGIPTVEQLKELLRIEIYVGSGSYIQTATGDAFNNIWEDNAILCYSPRNAQGKGDLYTPSFGYSFNYKGLPSIRTYWKDNAQDVKIIDGRTYSAVAILMSNAGYIINDTNA